MACQLCMTGSVADWEGLSAWDHRALRTATPQDNGQPGNKGWAFGLGLERLAMVLFDIPDIRCVARRSSCRFVFVFVVIFAVDYAALRMCHRLVSGWTWVQS